MMKIGEQTHSDNEIIGYKFRIYPSKVQVEVLRRKQDDLKRVWNWLVQTLQTEPQAKLKATAIERGVVPPSKPEYAGLTPEEAKARKKAQWPLWVEFYKAAKKACPDCPSFLKLKDVLEERGYKHDYQLFTAMPWIGGNRPTCFELQAVLYAYRKHGTGQKQKRKKRSIDSMPLVLRSGPCFELGEFETRAHKVQSPRRWNCVVRYAGLKIPGRSHRSEIRGVSLELLVERLRTVKATGCRMLEGVAIREEADGWYASVKCEVPKAVLKPVVPGKMIGLDVGRDFIVAGSDGFQVENNRLTEFSERIAGRQAQDLPVGKMQQKAARFTSNLIYTRIVKHCADCEVVAVEETHQLAALGGSVKVSAMGKVRTILQQKLPGRVREVPPHYTSQECSQCGFRSKESWSYEQGRRGKCGACGFQCDRDINAARNILRKYLESLKATAA